MKKIFALLIALTLLLSITACGSNKLTMRTIIEANQIDKLLEANDSVSILGTMNGEPYIEYYFTKDCAYEKGTGWAMYITDDAGYICSNGQYGRLVFIAEDGLGSAAEYRAGRHKDVLVSQNSLKEKIQTIEETGDRIVVTSVMDPKTVSEVIEEEGVQSYNAEYVVDAKTYGMITARGILTAEDGTTVDGIMACSYNVEMPEEAKIQAEYLAQTEDLRTVTLVFHAGTEKEKAETVQAIKGHAISLTQMPESVGSMSLYADAACTEAYASNGDYTSDVTIYVKWNS